MAKYDITYSCGHEGEIKLTGSTKDRESYLDWASRNKVCPDCYQKRLQEKRDAKNRASAAVNIGRGLAALEGSSKQIAWAETIRAQFLEPVTPEFISKMRLQLVDTRGPEYRAAAQIFLAVIERLEKADNAAWWIDNRSHDLRYFAKKAFDYYKQTGVVPADVIKPPPVLPELPNPVKQPLLTGDAAFLRSAMKRLGIPHVRVLWSESKKKHPDIWVQLGNPPTIYVTAGWYRQSAAERRKRLVHELGHVIGLEHGIIDGLRYSTYPDKDEFSRHVYKQLVNNPPEYLTAHPEFKTWYHPKWVKEKQGPEKRREKYAKILAATGNRGLASRARDWTDGHVDTLLRSLRTDNPRSNITVIAYDRSMVIRNIEQLPRGTGAKYLEVMPGHRSGEYIAIMWRQTQKVRSPGNLLLSF